ncbi:hypothetical protein OM416_19690 [Paenibacillus sp. LS1]|uniref:hypothetical protein n=1 Tax=Paenibacillus sp. LS1 TaxID=2992120 RepID=UPI00222F7A59|nr:hypothetical protein [Paenibacillus sp. LS1]MCW3793818.1 hypothetical protein [Paenibacillus sp. LS1]
MKTLSNVRTALNDVRNKRDRKHFRKILVFIQHTEKPQANKNGVYGRWGIDAKIRSTFQPRWSEPVTSVQFWGK